MQPLRRASAPELGPKRPPPSSLEYDKRYMSTLVDKIIDRGAAINTERQSRSETCYPPVFDELEYGERQAHTRPSLLSRNKNLTTNLGHTFQERVRLTMKEKGFDTLIVACPANIHYLTGFDGWGFYMPMFVVITQDIDKEPYPILIARGMDAAAGAFATHLPLNRIFAYEDSLVDNPNDHPMRPVCDLILRQGWGAGTIALEMSSDYCTARHLSVAHEALGPGVRLVDCNRLVNWVRLVKSEAELVKVREAAAIAEKAFQAALWALEEDPFVRGCDMVGEVVKAQIQGTPAYGGTFTAIPPMTSSGRDSDAGHMNWSSRPYLELKPDGSLPVTEVGEGAAVAMEVAGSRDHYHCPMARTVMLGNPSEAYLRFVACSYRGIEAMLALARPGRTCEELYWAYQNVLVAEGYSKASRVGYSFGVGFAPDWGEKTVSCRPGDQTVLQPGMCLHLIAGAGDGYVFETSEAVIITEGAPELLHDPRRRRLVVQRVPTPTRTPDPDLTAGTMMPPRENEEEALFPMEIDMYCSTRERYCGGRVAPIPITRPTIPVSASSQEGRKVGDGIQNRRPLRSLPLSSDGMPRVESVEDIMGVYDVIHETHAKGREQEPVFMPRDLGP